MSEAEAILADPAANEPQADAQHLLKVLERISELYAEKDRLDREAKSIGKQIAELEPMAVEAIAASGLDRVRAAGKSWGVREFFAVSIPSDNRDKVVEAARAEGLDDYVTVNTSSLKSWLADRRKREGGDTADSLAAGTKFDGLISEYREMRLSRLTLG
jgi:hypothetical protein